MLPLECPPASAATAASEPRPDDDRALVARTLQGDHDAFAAIMRRHNRRLYRLARATLRDETEAEDALQDAYLDAYRGLARFRHDAALSTWLSRLVLNQCYARQRRAGRRQTVVPIRSAGDSGEIEGVADEASAPDVNAMREQMRARLERELDALPEDFRHAFVLREVEEMSVAEAAACLGIPEATVRTRSHRARELLRVQFARDLELATPDVYEFGGERCRRIVDAVLQKIRRDG
jgi:RNA polymerase sigma-70 factor (ECF subfamily)